ncbi:MAG: hypothetical protein Q8M31_08295 [Beijerinckiaceae bacterium]|nr:hypothetical protein [Beijerinckiaceae bacterium]
MTFRTMTFRQSGSIRALVAAVGGALVLGLAVSTPAKALDDGQENVFVSVFQLLTAGVGIGGANTKPTIEYRERAPLVLPPNTQQLPPPGTGAAARNANWPQDSDQQRNRRTQARDRAPRDREDEFGGRRAPTSVAGAPAAGARDPRECRDDPLERLCNTEQFWATMSQRKQSEQRVAVGQEPPRRALTDPPAGFRAQTTEQKYTFEVERRIDVGDARAQQLEEDRRKRAIARGEDPNF